MRVVDTALLGPVGRGTTDPEDGPDRLAMGGLIGGDDALPVWVGETGIDPAALTERKVIEYEVPFAYYTSAVGEDDPESARLSGRRTRLSVPFYIGYVGTTLEQTKWAGERLRLKLVRTRPVIEGFRTWPITLEVSQRVRRDDNVMRPNGSPLYYGIDEYAVSILLTQTGVTTP
jgi:hypothetical protein